jgi:hypothetical protein
VVCRIARIRWFSMRTIIHTPPIFGPWEPLDRDTDLSATLERMREVAGLPSAADAAEHRRAIELSTQWHEANQPLTGTASRPPTSVLAWEDDGVEEVVALSAAARAALDASASDEAWGTPTGRPALTFP